MFGKERGIGYRCSQGALGGVGVCAFSLELLLRYRDDSNESLFRPTSLFAQATSDVDIYLWFSLLELRLVLKIQAYKIYSY